MTTDEAREAIHGVLTAEGFDRTSHAGEQLRYEGTIRVAGRRVSAAVVFPCLDFTVFPKVFLLNAAAELPGVAAHLDAADSVCFAAPGSIVLDKYDPVGTALQVLERTVATLEACISEEAAPDIRAEFAQYWGKNACLTAIPHDAPDGPAWLVVVPRGRLPQLTVLTRDDEDLAVFLALPK